VACRTLSHNRSEYASELSGDCERVSHRGLTLRNPLFSPMHTTSCNSLSYSGVCGYRGAVGTHCFNVFFGTHLSRPSLRRSRESSSKDNNGPNDPDSADMLWGSMGGGVADKLIEWGPRAPTRADSLATNNTGLLLVTETYAITPTNGT